MNVCKDCGAPIAFGKSSGKPYCSAKCWLQPENNPPPVYERFPQPNAGVPAPSYQANAQNRIDAAVKNKRDGINSSVAINNATSLCSNGKVEITKMFAVADQILAWLEKSQGVTETHLPPDVPQVTGTAPF